MRFELINPATGAMLRTVDTHTPDEVNRRLDESFRAFEAWRGTLLPVRGTILARMAEILRRDAQEWAELMAEEMGKPITQGAAEAEKSAWVCDFYAQNSAAWLAPEPVSTDARRSYVRHDPLGPILAIMPWNFPFWQLFRFAAPALMAGNAIVLKHAVNTAGCGVAIEQIGLEAGLAPGLLTNVLVDHDVIPGLLADPRIVGVTLTGSERAGRAVGMEAGRNLKKAVLELGGSDPFVVLEDADLDWAAETAAKARLQNTGQSCIAAKRFIVMGAVAEGFTRRFREHLARAAMGDPRDPRTVVGPIAREDLRQELHRQVRASVDGGACCLLGGEIPSGPGFFYPPTLLADVRPGMPAWDQELFGPVAAVRVVHSEAEALAAANDCRYGLGASVWTQDDGKAEAFAARLEAGAVFVNGMVKSDPRMPFGGLKCSGYGRELSHHGLREFVNIKTVWLT